MSDKNIYAIKGLHLKEKLNTHENSKLWTWDYINDKVYLGIDEVVDENWYRIHQVKNEYEITEIKKIKKIPEYIFYI